MDERPEQRPEGALIAVALRRTKLSQRQAAAKAGMSENRWRAIMHGYQSVSAGVNAPVRGPADTVARMAQVVGVTPEQLEGVDRPDAAEELRGLLTEKRVEPASDIPDRTIAELRELIRDDPELGKVMAELISTAVRRRREQNRDESATPELRGEAGEDTA